MKLLLMLVLLTSSCTPISTNLNVNMKYQRMDSWCWAAVSSSIINYYQGAKLNDCDVVGLYLGRKDCCPFNLACDVGINKRDLNVLLKWYDFNINVYDYPLDYNEVIKNIVNNRLIILGSTDKGYVASHVSIISGYDNDAMIIHDSNLGLIRASRDELRQYYKSWIFTIVIEWKNK